MGYDMFGLACSTIIVVALIVALTTASIKKRAIDKRAEVEAKQLQLTFPEEKQTIEQQVFLVRKRAFDELLERRHVLSSQISELRSKVSWGPNEQFNQYRADAMGALVDARKEQQELVAEQRKMLEMMNGGSIGLESESATEKPVRVDPGGLLAQPLDDPGDMHDVELHEPETG